MELKTSIKTVGAVEVSTMAKEKDMLKFAELPSGKYVPAGKKNKLICYGVDSLVPDDIKKQKKYYIVYNPNINQWCGHKHRTYETANKCRLTLLTKDKSWGDGKIQEK